MDRIYGEHIEWRVHENRIKYMEIEWDIVNGNRMETVNGNKIEYTEIDWR